VSPGGQEGRGPDAGQRRPPRANDADPAGVRRVFVAVPLPEPARAEVAQLVEGVRAAADPAVRDVRWVRLDGLHLTLRFIGPVHESALPGIVDAVKQAAARMASFDIAIQDAGAFPSTGRPRALWLDVVEGDGELAAAAVVLDDELERVGFERTTRPYRAHLTVARSDGVRSGAEVARRLIEAAAGRRTTFRASEVVLFESVSGGGPARYVPLAEADLLATASRLEPERSSTDGLIPSEPSVESRASVGPRRKEQGPAT
jgi:2'-5' RNA ligase